MKIKYFHVWCGKLRGKTDAYKQWVEGAWLRGKTVSNVRMYEPLDSAVLLETDLLEKVTLRLPPISDGHLGRRCWLAGG